MKSNPFSNVEKATVTFIKKGGQGILINNGLILTAAHCVDFDNNGKMTLGEYYIEEIQTYQGILKVSPLSIEPISDIAIAGGLDNQEFYFESNQFEKFCKSTKPIKICKNKLEPSKKFKIFIFTHEAKWISGYAFVATDYSHKLIFETDHPIIWGTSGSAIVNEKAEIVGIVSNASISDKSDAIGPRPNLTLPKWIYNQIYIRNQ